MFRMNGLRAKSDRSTKCKSPCSSFMQKATRSKSCDPYSFLDKISSLRGVFGTSESKMDGLSFVRADYENFADQCVTAGLLKGVEHCSRIGHPQKYPWCVYSALALLTMDLEYCQKPYAKPGEMVMAFDHHFSLCFTVPPFWELIDSLCWEPRAALLREIKQESWI